jgi:hypothetical protein
MGRWMQVVRECVPFWHERFSEFVVNEAAPHPLMYAARCLSRSHRERFPMIELVRFDSDAYVSEELWLDSASTERLLEEFRRLRRIVHADLAILRQIKGFITHPSHPSAPR